MLRTRSGCTSDGVLLPLPGVEMMRREASIGDATVSVVIPSYNCGHYVVKAVESVLKQSCPPQEIILVDDGSTDHTREVLEPYRKAIVYLYQKNAGEPAARNTGIRHASGEFIAFLDADDMWLPEKLELQMEYFARHPEVALVYSDMAIFDETGILHESVKDWLKVSMPSGFVFPQLFAETLFGSGTVVFRKSSIEKVGYFDETFFVGSDYEMWLRMARYFKFGYVDKPLLMYRQHASMATRGLGLALQDGLPWEAKVITKILSSYPEVRRELGDSTVRRRLARPYFYLGYSCLDRGNHDEARKLLSRSLRQWPWSLRCQLLYALMFLTPSQVSGLRNVYHRLFAQQ